MRASFIATALLWAVAAIAQAPAAGPGSGRESAAAHMDHLAILLDLTDAQKAQVQTILQEEHAKMKEQFAQARASGQRPSFDEMKTQHAALQQETLAKLTPVLNPAQLKKFQVLMQERGSPHGFGRHRGPPPGDSVSAPPPQ